ncbi:MAG: cell division protein FtsA [Pseudomonadota bacterium]
MVYAKSASAKPSKRRLAAAIDLGASKVACLIAAIDENDETEIIGVGQQGIVLRDARRDTAAASETALRAAVDAAERMAGSRIHKAVFAAPGRQLLARRIGVDLDLAGGAVTREDVRDCLDQGVRLAACDGARALHALPVAFSVDGEEAGSNPCGLMGGALTTQMLGVSVRESCDANIRALAARCDLAVERLIAAPFAASQTVLVDDEKDLGCLMVDIGARTTDFAVFEDGALVACGGVKLGGEHITRDIAQIFGGPIADAERMKTLHGSALPGAGDDHRFAELTQLGQAHETARVTKSELTAVIAPRLEEILSLTFEAAVHAVGRQSSAGLRRAVLTGGGSLLTGARETAERVFGVKARLGRPTALNGAPDAATAPQFSVCVGALQQAAQPQEGWLQSGEEDYFRRDQAHASGGGLWGGVAKWMRANF